MLTKQQTEARSPVIMAHDVSGRRRLESRLVDDEPIPGIDIDFLLEDFSGGDRPIRSLQKRRKLQTTTRSLVTFEDCIFENHMWSGLERGLLGMLRILGNGVDLVIRRTLFRNNMYSDPEQVSKACYSTDSYYYRSKKCNMLNDSFPRRTGKWIPHTGGYAGADACHRR